MTPRRRGRPRKTDVEGDRESEAGTVATTSAHDILSPHYDIACPEYVEIKVPRDSIPIHTDIDSEGIVNADYREVSSLDVDSDEEVMYKLEWRDLERWGIYGEGTFVSSSSYGVDLVSSDASQNNVSEGLSFDDLGLHVIHPGVDLDLAQKAAIRSLCERRSVIYSSPEDDSELAIIRDVALRSYKRGSMFLYCSPSRRKSERIYAYVAELIGEENVDFNFGDVNTSETNFEVNNGTKALIVSAELLHEMIFNVERRPLRHAQVVILDDFIHSEQSHRLWEEIIVAMPTRILIAMLCERLAERDRKELPLWFNHVMNATCKAFRLNKAVPCKTYVFNAASDVTMRGLIQGESAKASLQRLSEALQSAEDADDLFDRSAVEKAETDAADAADTLLSGVPGPAVTSRENLLLAGSEIELDSSTLAQIALRGGSMIPSVRTERLPLLALIHGREEAEMSIRTLFSALRGVPLINVDEEEQARDTARPVKEELKKSGAFTEEVCEWFDHLTVGCAVIHNGLLPIQCSLAEELFRAGFVKVLAVDTHIGACELANLPSARTVVVEASVLTHFPRAGKGVVHGSLLVDLAGRRGEDDESTLVVVWDDDECSSQEMAASAAEAFEADISPVMAKGVASDIVSVLRTLYRFGGEDWQQLWTLSLGELRRSTDCEPIAQEKAAKSQELQEKQDRLRDVDWVEIAKLTRVEAKVRERARVLYDMFQHRDVIWTHFVVEKLRIAPVGTVLGLRDRGDSEYSDSGEGGEDQADDGNIVSRLLCYLDKHEDKMSNLADEVAIPAALVSVFSDKGERTMICVIGTDGIFRLVPASDIIAIEPSNEVLNDAASLSPPLEGEFDEDPESGWKTATGLDSKEAKIAESVGEALESYKGRIFGQQPDELNNQIRRFTVAEKELQMNAYFGRKEDVEKLRRERRRMVELKREVEVLEEKLKTLMQGAPRRRSLPARIESRLQALQELNCTSSEDGSISTMGMITLHLACESPFWIMASLLLTEFYKLDWYDMAAAIVSLCSDFNQTMGKLYEGGEYREDFSAAPIVTQTLDLRDNIRTIEDKYDFELDQRMLTPLDTRLTRLVRNWAQGDLWQDAIEQVDLGGLGPGDIIRVIRRAIGVAKQFADEERQPWIVSALRAKVKRAADGLNRIPVQDFDLLIEMKRKVLRNFLTIPNLQEINNWAASSDRQRKRNLGKRS
eukprot:CAMPEP_0198724494 /NCGR_PEP_ID=MMETSP1475-20131203/1949_1 /TAXON_ID= ORGANISM="Unidentified sp., Strain CCMP1999" /NCGR_SAMPLE_ID=MMETSP1475 /ASSEMBLY_ACC=CAM_ASM_001111 /LENGTH=1197 /DNA_ID=CAMNT_0044486033 /DNA_START=132 /DNA_END=3725 /DNA_ORIENTATION=+